MQVYKAFLQIAKKKKGSAIMYFGVFIVLAIILSKTGATNDAKSYMTTKLTIAVENQDTGELGNGLIDYLSQTNQIETVPATEDELMDSMYTRDIDYVLYIPQDFSEKFVSGNREHLLTDRKVPSSSYGALADNQIESYLTTIAMYTEGGFTISQAMDLSAEDFQKTAEVDFAEGMNQGDKEAISYYFQYLPYIFICSTMLVLGPVLIAFRKQDINARNKCSSMSFFTRNMQLVLGSITITMLEYIILMIVVMMLAPNYVFSVKGILCMLNAFIASLLALALTYFVSQLITKEQTLDMMSNVLGLAFAFLGGIFVPTEMFGKSVLKVAQFIPTYWYVKANDAIQTITSLSNLPKDIYHGFGIQIAFIAAVMSMGLWINRMKARDE